MSPKLMMFGGALGALALLSFSKSDTFEAANDLDPRMKKIVEIAQSLGGNFKVVTTTRTVEEQKKLLEKGASKYTSDPRTAPHVRGIAVDVWALPNENDWKSYVEIARLFAIASEKVGVPVRWGGAWETLSSSSDPEAQAYSYRALKESRGEKPFVDPGHFELRV